MPSFAAGAIVVFFLHVLAHPVEQQIEDGNRGKQIRAFVEHDAFSVRRQRRMVPSPTLHRAAKQATLSL
ncbi:MAG: hypothetical protein LBV49_12985 [Azonexus sp.]|jgi:hypothetical protein|nr:hypothetical protein [Azonexus sp.]